MITFALLYLNLFYYFNAFTLLHCVESVPDTIDTLKYPLKPQVLKFEYAKPQNFKYGTTVECARKLSQS